MKKNLIVNLRRSVPLAFILAICATIMTLAAFALEQSTELPVPVTSLRHETTTESFKADKKTNYKANGTTLICPSSCTCSLDKRVSCTGKQFSFIPDLSKFTNFSHFDLSNNSIQTVNFSCLPPNLETLNVSFNKVGLGNRSFIINKGMQPLKLQTLLLSNNQLSSLMRFSGIKFPALQSLDLSFNPIKELNETSFINATALQYLMLTNIPVNKIHELTFRNLTNLVRLNMSGVDLSKFETHLGPKQFIGNQKLISIDLSNTSSMEIPIALRAVSDISELYFSRNLLTSLRASDLIGLKNLSLIEITNSPKLTKVDDEAFGGLRNLTFLYLVNNPKLEFISKFAFLSDNHREISIFDLRGNNMSKMDDPKQFSSVSFKRILLDNNPWHCDCHLEWMRNIPLESRSLVHCKTPEQFRDMEISAFLSNGCLPDRPDYNTTIAVGFLLLLLGILIAVLVQKNLLCGRFLRKDQYGSIYYTKARFPQENL